MASVYRRNGRNGKPYNKTWWYRFKDERGKWQSRRGWEDKTRTEHHAAKIEADCRAVVDGDKPKGWIVARSRPIREIIAEYLAAGEAAGVRGGPWIANTVTTRRTQLDWWINELGLQTLRNIDRPAVEAAAVRLRTGKDAKAPGTVWRYVTTLQSFCAWCERRQYVERNPLAALSVDSTTTTPHRVLTDIEVRALLAIAPPDRLVMYRTALETGYRVCELGRLTVASLDRFGPSLCLSGELTKNKKPARQPISRELAEELATLSTGKPPEAPLLASKDANVWRKLKSDLRRAQVAPKTDKGRATWHSLRKSFISALVAAGHDIKTCMVLARHTAAALTLDVYSQADPKHVRAAAQGAAEHFKTLAKPAPCDTLATQKVAQGGGEPITPVGSMPCDEVAAPLELSSVDIRCG